MFLLLLMGLGAASVKAQVRIGGNAAPNASAVLDLNATDAATGTKGLALPRVSLASTTDLMGNTSLLSGMLVYNTNSAMTNGQGTGVYAWDGSKWLVIAAESGTAGSVTGSKGTYRTWCFPAYTGLGCWMTDNSLEGTPSATAAPTWSPGWNGYYYSRANANTACPSGYALPTNAQWTNLANYINSPRSSALERMYMTSSAGAAGVYSIGAAVFVYQNLLTLWWISDNNYAAQGAQYRLLVGTADQSTSYYGSVRCVKQ